MAIRKVQLPADAQGTTTMPCAPARVDVHALVASIARELGTRFKPGWAVFVQEYLIDANAARAAKAAGYSPRSDKSAPVRAARLLAHPVVKEALARLQRERRERLQVEADEVLLNLVRIGTVDPRELVYPTGPHRGRLKRLDDLTADVAICIASIDFNRDGSVKRVKFWNKLHALEILAKHLGLLRSPDASAQLPAGVGALLTMLEPSHLSRLTDAEVEQVAAVVALAKRIVADATKPLQFADTTH